MFNPVAMSAHCYDFSVHSTMLLCKSILGGMTFELDVHIETVSSAKCFDRQFKFEHLTNIFDQLINQICLLGCGCHLRVAILICLLKSSGMPWLCIIRNLR